jgi:small multidrug resistance family-3 protein
MSNYLWFFAAGFFEIAGCYCFWAWLRMDKSIFWLIPGVISLALFAFILTKVDLQFAGRSYAAYGGIYIVLSLFWLAFIENNRPLITDYLGAVFCLVGTTIILFGPRLNIT